MSKILITAFEPFGIIGEHIRGQNRSQIILDTIQRLHPENYHFLTLPVSDEGISRLCTELETIKPTGIINMGEHMLVAPRAVKVEPFAYDTKASVLPDLMLAFRNKVKSPFATAIAPDDSSMIGNYYCNQAYLQSMNWATLNGNPPVAFIHVPTFGNHDRHTHQVLEIAHKMEDYEQPSCEPGSR